MSNLYLLRLKEKWGTLTPITRTAISIGVLFGSAMVFAAFILPENHNAAQNTTQHQQRLSETNLILPQRKDTSLEGLAAEQESLRGEQTKAGLAQIEKDRQLEEMKRLLEDVSSRKPVESSSDQSEIAREFARISNRLDEIEKGRIAPGLEDALPSPTSKLSDANADQGDIAAPPSQPVMRQPKMQILGQLDPKLQSQTDENTLPIPYLPSGAMFEGRLINGMDAPTSSVTQKNPVPALIRVKTDAVLPNRNNYDISECFVIVSGYGVMATERAQLRTESLSCVKENGEVIEGKLDGYVVGEDGKVGLRGRLVSKQGSVLAQSMAAGFLGGFAQNMVPSPVSQMNITPGTVQQYQTPNLNAAAQAGISKGVSDSAKMLSQFYLDMASEMFPVIEIDAGRRVTLILLHGIELLPTK